MLQINIKKKLMKMLGVAFMRRIKKRTKNKSDFYKIIPRISLVAVPKGLNGPHLIYALQSS